MCHLPVHCSGERRRQRCWPGFLREADRQDMEVEKETYYKELAHAVMQSGKSKILRVGHRLGTRVRLCR